MTPRASRIVLAAIASAVVVVACTSGEDIVLATGDDPEPQSSFTSPDATVDVEVAMGLTSYCPSNKCPVGRTTCPTSLFRCDVNLLSDRDNCGGCGVRCPAATNREIYECVDGRCVMQCQTFDPTFDCDGVPDNGCETMANTNEACGACGIKCSDPAKPCVQRSVYSFDVGCGCLGQDLYCSGACKKGQVDDRNCGSCGTVCDPGGDGGTPRANAYYGCSQGECGHLKCMGLWGNCDGDPENGCETNLVTPENCGLCGKSCAPGQICGINAKTGSRQCMCPDGQTFCPTSCINGVCTGECFDLTSDAFNCGACGVSCSYVSGSFNINACRNGTCVQQCHEGRADCNGNTADSCEVNTNSDPMNCGGCGKACDVAAGQACVGGRCVVEPCADTEDAGGPK